MGMHSIPLENQTAMFQHECTETHPSSHEVSTTQTVAWIHGLIVWWCRLWENDAMHIALQHKLYDLKVVFKRHDGQGMHTLPCLIHENPEKSQLKDRNELKGAYCKHCWCAISRTMQPLHTQTK